MDDLQKIGNQQVKLLINLGGYLTIKGNVGRTAVFNKLGMTKQDVSKSLILYQFKEAVKDCTSVVLALQICGAERDKLRRQTKGAKPLTPEELETKRLKDIAENEDFNAHRAMTA